MVELMVAMLIGLIGMIIIFQVFEVSEGIKRTTTSGGDAQQNGAIALYVMEHDLRNAGMGFNDVSYAGCKVLAYDSKRVTPDFTMTLVPVSITPGATAKVPDQFTVLYGSGALVANPSMLSVNMDSAGNGADPLSLTNPYAFRPGDLVVLLEPASLKNCSLMELTALNGTTVFQHQVNTGYLLLGTLTNEVSRFNRPGGLGVFYAGVGSPTGNVTRVYNLGNLYEPANRPNIPVNNTYAIDASNALTVTATFTGKNVGAPLTNPVADNIVHLRALYGLDDGVGDASVTIKNGGVNVAGDGLVDRFVDAATFNALATPPWQSLIAVRVAIVARSALSEKATGAGGTCETTMAFPTWSGGTFDLSADPNWQCYRYRVFETTVPLRNWIWKSS
jgi:type IV pilus assembly protein PilW